MSERKLLVPYDPTLHAEERHPAYAGSHIVADDIPLSQVIFCRHDDVVGRYIGPRDPDACPVGRENLVATPEMPPIYGEARRQHLTVMCAARVILTGASGIGYPICTFKLDRGGINPTHTPEELVDGTQEYRCPFYYLGGRVIEGDAVVEVAIDSEPPVGEIPKYQAV